MEIENHKKNFKEGPIYHTKPSQFEINFQTNEFHHYNQIDSNFKRFSVNKEVDSRLTCSSKNMNSKFRYSERISVYSTLNFDKETIIEQNNEFKNDNDSNNIKGSLLMIAASLLVAIIFAFQKILFTNFPLISYQQQNLVRGSTMAFLNFVHGKLNNEKFIYDDMFTNFTVFRRIFCGFTAEILLYLSTNYLRINTASTFYILFGVVCSVMSCIILKESLSKKELINIILCFLSSCFIIKPFFGSGQDTFTGFILGILFIFFLSATVILHKLLNGNIGTYMIYFWYGIFYIIEASISCLVVGVQFYWTWEILLYLIILGTLCSYTNYIYILAINCGNVSYVLPFENTNVVFSLLLGYYVLDESCDFLDVFGTVSIISLCFYRSYLKIRQMNEIKNTDTNTNDLNVSLNRNIIVVSSFQEKDRTSINSNNEIMKYADKANNQF